MVLDRPRMIFILNEIKNILHSPLDSLLEVFWASKWLILDARFQFAKHKSVADIKILIVETSLILAFDCLWMTESWSSC